MKNLKKIYIFDEYSSSKQNGIGTFLQNLRLCLKETFDLYMLSFNDDVKYFCKENIEGVEFLRFPIYGNGSFLKNIKQGLTIIRMEVLDDYDNIFIVPQIRK